PSSTSHWHVAHEAERQENGMGNHCSSARSMTEPPSGTSTSLRAPAGLDSTTSLGMAGSLVTRAPKMPGRKRTPRLARWYFRGGLLTTRRLTLAKPLLTLRARNSDVKMVVVRFAAFGLFEQFR